MDFTIASRRRADGYLSRGWYDGMISISDPPGDRRGELRTGNDLLLDFDDCYPEQKRPRRVLATEADIEKILEWLVYRPQMALIHCGRGRSRSTAAAIIALRAMHPTPYTDFGACRRLFSQSPKANPNGWMLRLADRLYGWSLHATCKKHFVVKG